ncbi:MAG TPA: tetratricopeptide repeat protein [Geothrix sp.]|nr:tetratricopeptide repeat protein [Geothrix sp.]
MTPDPYAPYLRQADELFAQGQVVKAGQIWQAILKQQPSHSEARERLLQLKQQLLAQREQELVNPAAQAAPEPEPSPEPPPPAPPALAKEDVVPSPAPVEARSTSPQPESPAPISVPSDSGEPAPSKAGEELDPDRLLREGCTLYDMGQLSDALQKWEQVLALDPHHALARSYANGVRREQGLPPLEESRASAPVEAVPFGADDDLNKLLREAVQLFDMGLTEEAISKWERVLVIDPQRHEVEGYLRDARKELAERPPAPSPAPPGPAGTNEPLDLKLRQAEHLLALQRHEEAAFTFQQALSLAPGHPAALAGLERCRKPAQASSARSPQPAPVKAAASALELDPQGRIAMAIVSEGTLGVLEPGAVAPPASLTQTRSAPRRGLALPSGFDEVLERMPWLKNPKVMGAIGGSVLVLGTVLFLLRGYLRDQELQRAVVAARASALAPLAKQTQVQDLSETPKAIREEAESALGTDPLRAYLRATTLAARAPEDAAAAQLLEKARAGLPGGVAGASLPEYQRHLQNGDLEAAAKVMDALLRAAPGDEDLRARAARLQLLLCTAHVGQGKWSEAADDLQRGRALNPDDKTWQARLHLLDRVKTMPKEQQAGWISLLG